MNILPIQVTERGVLIPLDYLQNAHQFEFEIENGHVLVRPKAEAEPAQETKSWLHGLVGIAETKDPTASGRVKEIIAAEIDARSGFTTKPAVDEEP
jgi:hypothetical protein